MRSGIANLPLHGGKCPAWLFKRMRLLAGAICEFVILEYGHEELLRRLANPFWFQSFGNVLGFDWHSSGLTTTVCGALKEAANRTNLGLAVAGGKGKVSRRAPQEIVQKADELGIGAKAHELQRASRLAAKVDNSCVQDGYQLYHHIFIFTEKGDWAVIQQGMNNNWARRYHWLSEGLVDFVCEPHSGIAGQRREEKVLDLTARQSKDAQKVILDIARDGTLLRSGQCTLKEFELNMPRAHTIPNAQRINRALLQKVYEYQPSDFEELLMISGVGPATIRALALTANLIYGAPLSWRDPIKYSFAHGGKDGTPFPVNKKIYDYTILTLQEAIKQAKVGEKEKSYALKRLSKIF